MKTKTLALAATILLLAGCYPAKIVTVSPYNEYQQSYTTTVTLPRANTVTTTTRVSPIMEDLSLFLDLKAVGAAFAQSNSIEEFESLLNNSAYLISNLDLNNDGFVDYLRVVETVEGFCHVFIIQAVLGMNVFQDIATIVVEAPKLQTWHVEIIGAPYIYGPNYILNPVFVTRPPIYYHFYARNYAYKVWHSPWYWNHFPPHYKHPVPIMLGHYQAYVNTYMRDHRYCRTYEYPNECHFKGYERVSNEYRRDDYGKQHPERSFTVRTANIPSSTSSNNGARRELNNARDIQARFSEGESTSTVTTSRPASRSASSSSGSTSPASQSRTSGTSGSTSSASPSRTSGSTGSQSAAAKSASPASQTTPSTTTRSNVRSTGSTNTRITTRSNDSSSTVNRNTGTTSPSRASSSSSSSSSSRTPSSSSSSSSSNPSRASSGSSSSSHSRR
ncbi:MAG: hypothetical protein MJY89_02180 [Bacteroidales bacterium]|nr:hypothetical protein [Bacteroidales bacterium]